MPRRRPGTSWGGRRWTPPWSLPPQTSERVSVAREAAASFKDGAKFVNGIRYEITGSRQCWSSNGRTIYTSLMWSDGKASCNCPGWATSKTVDKLGNPKDKTCTHSRDVRAGDNITVGTVSETYHPGRVEAEPSKKRKIIL